MRGDGQTTRQMQAAPELAVFVWVNNHLDYPRALARKLDRHDLEIVSPSWLLDRWRGRQLSAVVVDHAAALDPIQQDNLRNVQAYVRMRAPAKGKAKP